MTRALPAGLPLGAGPSPAALRRYDLDSPAAMGRVVVLLMIADGQVHEREVALLKDLDVYRVLGLSRTDLTQVVRDYFTDLRAGSMHSPSVALASRPWVDAAIAQVQAPDKRRLVASVLVNIAKADGAWSDVELAVLAYILERWGLDADALGSA